jgi:hypothetical protein
MRTLYSVEDWCDLCDFIEHSVDENAWKISGEVYHTLLLIIFENEVRAKNTILRAKEFNTIPDNRNQYETLYGVLFDELDKMPLYLNSKFAPISLWRLKFAI